MWEKGWTWPNKATLDKTAANPCVSTPERAAGLCLGWAGLGGIRRLSNSSLVLLAHTSSRGAAPLRTGLKEEQVTGQARITL